MFFVPSFLLMSHNHIISSCSSLLLKVKKVTSESWAILLPVFSLLFFCFESRCISSCFWILENLWRLRQKSNASILTHLMVSEQCLVFCSILGSLLIFQTYSLCLKLFLSGAWARQRGIQEAATPLQGCTSVCTHLGCQMTPLGNCISRPHLLIFQTLNSLLDLLYVSYSWQGGGIQTLIAYSLSLLFLLVLILWLTHAFPSLYNLGFYNCLLLQCRDMCISCVCVFNLKY